MLFLVAFLAVFALGFVTGVAALAGASVWAYRTIVRGLPLS